MTLLLLAVLWLALPLPALVLVGRAIAFGLGSDDDELSPPQPLTLPA